MWRTHTRLAIWSSYCSSSFNYTHSDADAAGETRVAFLALLLQPSWAPPRRKRFEIPVQPSAPGHTIPTLQEASLCQEEKVCTAWCIRAAAVAVHRTASNLHASAPWSRYCTSLLSTLFFFCFFFFFFFCLKSFQILELPASILFYLVPVPFFRRSGFCGTCLLLSLAVVSIVRSPNWSPTCSYCCYKCDDQEQYGSIKMYSRRYSYSLLLWTSMLILDVFFSSEWVLSSGLLCNFVCDRNCRNLCSLNILVHRFCMLWHIVETTACPLHHHYMSMNCVQSILQYYCKLYFCLCSRTLSWRRTHLSNLGLHSSAVHEGAEALLQFFWIRVWRLVKLNQFLVVVVACSNSIGNKNSLDLWTMQASGIIFFALPKSHMWLALPKILQLRSMSSKSSTIMAFLHITQIMMCFSPILYIVLLSLVPPQRSLLCSHWKGSLD